MPPLKPIFSALVLAALAVSCTPLEDPPPLDAGGGGTPPAMPMVDAPPVPDAAPAIDALPADAQLAPAPDATPAIDTSPADAPVAPAIDASPADAPVAPAIDAMVTPPADTAPAVTSCKADEKRCGTDCMPEGATCKCPQLPNNCGAAASESCCLSLPVPGGTFNRGAFNNFPATVSSFSMDKFEVTVGRFRRFVDSGMGVASRAPREGAGAHPKIPGSGWRAGWNNLLATDTAALKAGLKCSHPWGGVTWTDVPGPHENRPITCVDWYSAFAFCIWEGGRLPTDTEHHYASKGGDEGRFYPWSAPAGSMQIDNNRASFWVDDDLMCMGDGVAGCTTADLVNVGSKPQGNGRWGHAELAGNAYEWVFDGFPEQWPQPCVDCATIEATQKYGRTTRSGSFSDKPPGNLTTGSRIYAQPDYRSGSGFRCASLAQ
jgi:sulfatase modifying factor 1